MSCSCSIYDHLFKTKICVSEWQVYNEMLASCSVEENVIVGGGVVRVANPSRKGPPTCNTVADKTVRTLAHSSLYSLTGLKHHCDFGVCEATFCIR